MGARRAGATLVVLMGCLAILGGCAPAVTEPPPGAVKAEAIDTPWLVGVWEGDQDTNCKVQIEFKEEAGDVRWDLVIVSCIRGSWVAGAKASGSAKVSGEAVEMEGKYVAVLSTTLSYSLKRKGEALEGRGFGARYESFHVSLRKVR